MADGPVRKGIINSSNPMDKSGVQFPGRGDTLFTVNAGSAKVSVTGTEGSDTVRVMPGSGDVRLSLGEGRNQVVLPGSPHDYHAVQPLVTDYPPTHNQTYWKNGQDSMYGSVSILENTTTGERYTITSNGPTRVVYDGQPADAPRERLSPAEADRITGEADSGKLKSASPRELLAAAESGNSPQENALGRYAGSKAGAEKLTELQKSGVPFAELGEKFSQEKPPEDTMSKPIPKTADWNPQDQAASGPASPHPSSALGMKGP